MLGYLKAQFQKIKNSKFVQGLKVPPASESHCPVDEPPACAGTCGCDAGTKKPGAAPKMK